MVVSSFLPSGEIGFSSLDSLSNTTSNELLRGSEYLKRHAIDNAQLLQYVDKFSDLSVLVIGDTIVDEYITCDAVGMSQEDPTIVVTPISDKKFIGGAAIVASHAKMMGANVDYISVVGEDDNYHFVKDYLTNLQVTTSLYQDATRPTNLKRRYRAENKTLLRVNKVKQHSIDKAIEKEIIAQIDQKIKGIDLVVLSDFSYGVLTDNIIAYLERIAQSQELFIVADSQSSSQMGDISKFKNMDLVTPTEREIRLALGDFSSGLVVLSDKLREKSHPKYIITTMGSEGVMIYNSNADEVMTDVIPALNTNPKDTSGAGDSLLITTAMTLKSGGNIWESVYLGSVVAGIQVGQLGSVPIKKEDIIKKLGL